MSEISLAGLDKAAVLAALYNNARPQGMGFLHYDPTPMSIEEAKTILESSHGYFDYLKGRVMKVNLTEETLDPWLYDRDNGEGSAERVINELRTVGEVNPESSKIAHKQQKKLAADAVKSNINSPGGIEREEDGTVVFRLGLADVADVLGPAVDEALDE